MASSGWQRGLGYRLFWRMERSCFQMWKRSKLQLFLFGVEVFRDPLDFNGWLCFLGVARRCSISSERVFFTEAEPESPLQSV